MTDKEIEILEQGGDQLLELAKENQRKMAILRQKIEEDDEEAEAERDAEYDRRILIPQTPLIELTSFDPKIGLTPKNFYLVRKEIAEWVIDYAAPPKPILSVVIGDSLTVRPKEDSNELDLLYAVMDNDFRKSLRPPECYLKFCSSSESHSVHEPFKYPGYLTDGPYRVVLWLTSGG